MLQVASHAWRTPNNICVGGYDTGGSEEKFRTLTRSRTYDLLVAGPGVLPLSYRKLVGSKDTKLNLKSGRSLALVS